MADPAAVALCTDPWHFPFVPDGGRERRQHDERRESSSCPACHWRGSGWVCVQCGYEIPFEEIAFRPRCLPCHKALTERLAVRRGQERIEHDCFDERPAQAKALRLHRSILKELA